MYTSNTCYRSTISPQTNGSSLDYTSPSFLAAETVVSRYTHNTQTHNTKCTHNCVTNIQIANRPHPFRTFIHHQKVVYYTGFFRRGLFQLEHTNKKGGVCLCGQVKHSVCVCVCVFLCVTYAHTYTHTYTHTYNTHSVHLYPAPECSHESQYSTKSRQDTRMLCRHTLHETMANEGPAVGATMVCVEAE